MFQLDDKFLEQVGLADMPEDEKKSFLLHIYGELEVRLGLELSKDMTDEQLDEFGEVAKKGEEHVRAWLEQNCPDFEKVIESEMEKLRQDIVANKDIILSRAQNPQAA